MSTQEMNEGPKPMADRVDRMNDQSTRSNAFSWSREMIATGVPEEEAKFAKNRDIFANEPPWNPASLILVNNQMDHFKKATGDDARSEFVVFIQEGDRTPVTRIQTMTLLERQR